MASKWETAGLLPVWDGVGDRDPLGYNGFETWERAVAVTSNPNPPETVDVSYLYNYFNKEDYNYKYENIKPVGIDHFYHIKLNKEVISICPKTHTKLIISQLS